MLAPEDRYIYQPERSLRQYLERTKTMNPVLAWALARLSEPSTWAGIPIFATGVMNALHSGLPTNASEWVLLGTQLLGGAAAAVKAEKAKH